jgi:hypothetical protein
MVSMISTLTAALLLSQAKPEDGGRSPEAGEPGCRTEGFTLTLTPDGRVELTVREQDPSTGKDHRKLYQADSLEEFKKKYPDLAKRYGIDRLSLGGDWPHLGQDGSGKDFEEWKKRFDDRWFWDRHHDGDFAKWLQELPEFLRGGELEQWIKKQRKLFEEFRQIEPKAAPESPGERREQPGKAELGVLVTPVDETLAHHLGLDRVQGVIIAQVRGGSLAQKAGLRKHDLLFKLNGNAIEDAATFRRDVQGALDKGFDLDVIREGKHEAIHVSPWKP